MPYIDQIARAPSPTVILILKCTAPVTQVFESEEVSNDVPARLCTSTSVEQPPAETDLDIKTLIRDLDLDKLFETLLLQSYGNSEDWAGGTRGKVMQWIKSPDGRRLTLVDKARVKALSRTITRWFSDKE